MAAGGSKGEVGIWDVEENEAISTHFTPYLDKTRVGEEPVDDEMEEEEKGGDSDDSDEEEKKARAKQEARLKKKEIKDK